MRTLSHRTISEFEVRLQELRGELKSLVEDFERRRVGHGTDEASVSSLTRARLAAELRRADAALGRIACGRFGLCERCGLPIGRNLLLADPTLGRCSACNESGPCSNSGMLAT